MFDCHKQFLKPTQNDAYLLKLQILAVQDYAAFSYQEVVVKIGTKKLPKHVTM